MSGSSTSDYRRSNSRSSSGGRNGYAIGYGRSGGGTRAERSDGYWGSPSGASGQGRGGARGRGRGRGRGNADYQYCYPPKEWVGSSSDSEWAGVGARGGARGERRGYSVGERASFHNTQRGGWSTTNGSRGSGIGSLVPGSSIGKSSLLPSTPPTKNRHYDSSISSKKESSSHNTEYSGRYFVGGSPPPPQLPPPPTPPPPTPSSPVASPQAADTSRESIIPSHKRPPPSPPVTVPSGDDGDGGKRRRRHDRGEDNSVKNVCCSGGSGNGDEAGGEGGSSETRSDSSNGSSSKRTRNVNPAKTRQSEGGAGGREEAADKSVSARRTAKLKELKLLWSRRKAAVAAGEAIAKEAEKNRMEQDEIAIQIDAAKRLLELYESSSPSSSTPVAGVLDGSESDVRIYDSSVSSGTARRAGRSREAAGDKEASNSTSSLPMAAPSTLATARRSTGGSDGTGRGVARRSSGGGSTSSAVRRSKSAGEEKRASKHIRSTSSASTSSTSSSDGGDEEEYPLGGQELPVGGVGGEGFGLITSMPPVGVNGSRRGSGSTGGGGGGGSSAEVFGLITSMPPPVGGSDRRSSVDRNSSSGSISSSSSSSKEKRKAMKAAAKKSASSGSVSDGDDYPAQLSIDVSGSKAGVGGENGTAPRAAGAAPGSSRKGGVRESASINRGVEVNGGSFNIVKQLMFKTSRTHKPRAMAFNPVVPGLFAVCSADLSVDLWRYGRNNQELEKLAEWNDVTPVGGAHMAWNPSGTHLAIGHSGSTLVNNWAATIIGKDSKKHGTVKLRSDRHNKPAQAVAWVTPSKNNQDHLVTGGEDGHVVIWTRVLDAKSDLHKVAILHSRHTSAVRSACCPSISPTVVTGGADGRLVSYSIETASVQWEELLRVSKTYHPMVNELLEFPDNPHSLLVSTVDTAKSHSFFTMDTRQPASLIHGSRRMEWKRKDEKKSFSSMVYPSISPCGRYVACAGDWNGCFHLWDVRSTRSEPMQSVLVNSVARVVHTAWHPSQDARALMSLSAATGQSGKNFALHLHGGLRA